jgi:hypothetical protein
MSERTLGEALTDELTLDGGRGTIHQEGIALSGEDLTATAWWGLLGIGRPVMVSGDPGSAQVMILQVEVEGPGVPPERIGTLLRSALEGRVVLDPTARSGDLVALVVGEAETAGDGVVVPVTAPAMSERVLYDVAVAGGPTVAPHAVYFKREWKSFGLAHVTDTHVARRIDLFRGLLVEAGRPAGAERLVNFNDRFRGFVKYANRLHDQQVLDLIVVTGDLCDYLREVVYEDAAGTPTAPAPNSNPQLLRDLILGQSDAPGFTDVEELRVPIFLIPGNHDYRVRPYHLVMDIKDPVVGRFDIDRVTNQQSFDLTIAEAAILTNRLYPKRVRNPATGEMVPAEVIKTANSEVPNVSPSDASDMIAVDDSLGDYHRYLGDPTSHTVVLGDHRIVLFDSGPDTGRVESVREFLAHRVGLVGGEDETTFLGGSPNCEGPTERDADEVARVLAEAPQHGLVIVASHAPLFNVWRTAYPYFLRETQRRHQPEQVSMFLLGLTPTDREAPVPENHPTWFDEDGAGEVDFVKRGDYDDLLDFGVCRGDAKRLLHVLAGVDLPRAADLLLTGHTHHDNECVVRRLPGGEPAVFHDYYTENPGTYYPSPFASTLGINGEFSRTWVQVRDGADPAGTPTATPGHDYTHELVVPPYADPLNRSADPVAWWETHRPLVLQTAALGPVSGLREFAGFRVVEVADNVIRRISRVPIERLERSGWALDWDSARAPIPATPVPEAPWLAVSAGATSPGARVSGVTVDDKVALFLADPSGGVYTASGTVANWGPWRPVSGGATVPGGAVTACVATDGKVTLIVTDANGGVYACRGRGIEWSGWVGVREGASIPGAPLSAIPGADGRISLFLADPDGGVYTCRGVGDDWDPWAPVSEGASTPGAPISAIADADGRISLFLADPDGGVYTCQGFGTDWGGWSDVRHGGTTPGGHITAIMGEDQLISLFVADVNGGIYTSRGSGTSWSNWAPVAHGSTTPGAPVSVFRAASVIPGHLAVVVADTLGGIHSVTGLEADWGMWTPVAEGVTLPGSPVTAIQVPSSAKVTTLAMADAQGGVFAKRTTL